MKTKGLLGVLFGSLLSLSLVKADLISPGQQITNTIASNVIISAGVVVVIIAVVAWLIIRKIKKKNVIKPSK